MLESDKLDIWALAVTIFSLLAINRYPIMIPFYHTLEECKHYIQTHPHLRLPFTVNRDFRYLIDSMLAKNPDERPSARDILKNPVI